jgi:conserved domain protein
LKKGKQKMEDWQRRFIDEYNSLKDKYTKLHKMIVKYEAGTLEFEPKCSIEVLKNQKRAMGQYLYWLEVRSEIEGIEL